MHDCCLLVMCKSIICHGMVRNCSSVIFLQRDSHHCSEGLVVLVVVNYHANKTSPIRHMHNSDVPAMEGIKQK